jgi:hypothetical protein
MFRLCGLIMGAEPMWEKPGKAKLPAELLAQVAECVLLETSGKNLTLQDTGPDGAQRAVVGNLVR